MTYERFEDLPEWKRAMDLAEKVYALTEAEQFKKRYSLRVDKDKTFVQY